MFYTYILICSDKRLYTGYTPDLKNRFKLYSLGKVLSTKRRLPVELIYYEACLDKQDAIRREKTLKSGPGKIYIKKRMKRFFQNSGWGPVTGAP